MKTWPRAITFGVLAALCLVVAPAVSLPGVALADSLTNNNAGSTGTAHFTQSEATLVAFGNTVVVGFNDSGSNAGSSNKFTGYAYSTDGGATFTDGGTLPTNPTGDAGDPVMARNDTTGRIYFAALGFTAPGTIQLFRSDTNGVTWLAPVNATPGGASENKEWVAVDNFVGAGNGNVYVVSRRFGGVPGIYFFRSTDHGDTFGPPGGILIVADNQGAFVAVGPDHSVYVFWYAGTTIQMRKSTDLGMTFGAPVTIASGLVGGINGDLALTGIRQGTATASPFRSNQFPHAAVNPLSGHLYVTYDNDAPGADKADVFLVVSTDGGATWSAPIRVNDDVTTTDQWQPTLAVTPDGSKLGIFYYSRQEDAAGNNLFKYYGRIGAIAGSTVTFTPSFAISNTPSLPEFGRDSVVNTVYMGDYDQAVATAGTFHVVWSDNRDDLPGGAPRKDPNVYYQKVAAQTGALQGTVTDAVTGLPISGVLVSADGSTTMTGASGHYEFPVLRVGSYDVTAEKLGYSAQTVSGVVVAEGTTTVQDLALSADPAFAAAICRTPGFWGTHACGASCEKAGSQNITQQVVNFTGCLLVCGEKITNTSVRNAMSALEAICVPLQGNSKLQNARQLTAMALNCVISGFGPDCAGNTDLDELFSDCNSACVGGPSTRTNEQCRNEIGCFNNGGRYIGGFCQTGTCANGDPCGDKRPCVDGSSCMPLAGNCHDRELCNEEVGLCFEPPGPAGSSKACNDANASACTVIQPGEASCTAGLRCPGPETCACTSCPCP